MKFTHYLIVFVLAFAGSAMGSIYALHFYPCVAHYTVNGYVDFSK